MKDRILLINYDFPPTLSGVRRITKLARYLPDHDFEPVILSATPNGRSAIDVDGLKEVEACGYQVIRTPSPDFDHAAAMLNQVLSPVRVVRKKLDHAAPPVKSPPKTVTLRSRMLSGSASFTRRIMALPDDRMPWLLTAIPMAEHLLRSQAIRYVLTSSYPNSTHLIGLYLKRRYNIHWHADFRDGWTQNPYFADYVTPLHRQVNFSLEQRVAEGADTLTGVSSPIVDHLATLSGRGNVVLLPNGFDPTDLSDVPKMEFDKFTLAYTGTMFMQRSPDSFFAAVRGLLDSYPGLTDNFQVIFRSNMKPEHLAMIRDLNLERVIINWGMGSWRDALSLQKSADALLVLEGENPNSHIMLTQKIFEYLAADKPILAVAPPGALADLVRRTRAGVVIAPDNVFRIKETLFELFLGRVTFKRNESLINSYTRQRQAEELAQILRGKNRGKLY